jgi:hypothetical protein
MHAVTGLLVRTLHLAVGASALVLGACGGGSTSASGSTSYNLAAAIGSLVTKGFSANISFGGSLTGVGTVSGSGTLTYTAAVNGTFGGSAALVQNQILSGSVTGGGATQAYATSASDYYAVGNHAFLGEQNTTAGDMEYDVAQSPFVYPTTVVNGSSGTLGTVSRYTDSTMGTVLGTAQYSYVVKPDAANSSDVIVELKSQLYDPQNNLQLTELDDYALSSSNMLTLVSATVQSPTEGTLTATAM